MISHLVDPDGDVDLLLLEEVALQLDGDFEVPLPASNLSYERPTAPILTYSKKNKNKGKWKESEPAQVVECLSLGESNDTDRIQELGSIEPLEECIASEADEALVRIRVSSKHLILASSYFKRSYKAG